jgi:acetyl-CoA synthetase (ADP-forming)
MHPDQIKQLLNRYKLPYAQFYFARTPEDAANLARKLWFPVAVKAISPTITHKMREGGIRLEVNSKEEVKQACKEMQKKIKRTKGFLVQNMEYGIETFIGVKKDPTFGPVILFGLGGIFVEILKDITYRVCPVGSREAMRMIKEIKGFPILQGYKGMTVNLDSLVKVIKKVSKLAMHEEFDEIDFNPVVVNSRSAKIIDFRFVK